MNKTIKKLLNNVVKIRVLRLLKVREMIGTIIKHILILGVEEIVWVMIL